MDSLRAEPNKSVAIGRQYGAEYQIFKTLKSAPPIFPDRMCSTHLQIAWIRDGEIATKHITALTGHYSNAVRSKHINRDYAWAINRTETPFTPYSLYYTAHIYAKLRFNTIQSHPIRSSLHFGATGKGLQFIDSWITHHLSVLRIPLSFTLSPQRKGCNFVLQ